jgi:glucosamine-6-phosphate deaminase
LECTQYEMLIEQDGGIDLQILGLGKNGHIGFNEPGTSFKTKTHVVELDYSTRIANSRFFNSVDEVPTHAITMGISTIFKSKEIILLISGRDKSQAFERLLKDKMSEDFPASIIKGHSNLTIIVD